MSSGYSDLTSSANFFAECLGWRIVGGTLAQPALRVVDGAVSLTLWQAQDRPVGPSRFEQAAFTAPDRRRRHAHLARRA